MNGRSDCSLGSQTVSASIHALVPHGSGTACCSRMTDAGGEDGDGGADDGGDRAVMVVTTMAVMTVLMR